ncbi:hypothetical protein [Laribacter hongkongensis]|uniref:hypothetical protein n=1 Tax=Laribacter hongkongensis TaxID=168471 RepID=UPI001EFE9455|nr:hypothetical protein [Laribacter hongkongensis]MCG9079468.1 hypothetical protein [Laribacter hongkongensis]
MSKKTYRVRGIDLDHDGTRYLEGSTIELGDDEAAEKRRWLEPVASTEPLALVEQTKSAKGTRAEEKKSTEGKADDKGQSSQDEGDKP